MLEVLFFAILAIIYVGLFVGIITKLNDEMMSFDGKNHIDSDNKDD